MLSQLLVNCSPCWITRSHLDIKGGAQPCFNLMCQALCKTIGGLSLSMEIEEEWIRRVVDRKGEVAEGEEGRN